MTGDLRPSFRPLAAPDRLWGMTITDSEVLQSRPRLVAADLLRLFLSERVPLTLWGPVGARKTRTVEALAREVDENGVAYQVITVQPSTEDPTVIHGLMYTTLDRDSGETVMRRSVPDIAQQVVSYWEQRGGLTVLFLDEMTTCMPAQQHALLGILTHGRYGDKDISPHIAVVMAANPPGTVSAVNDLGEQVMNRGGHIAWFEDRELFLTEWRSGFGDPRRRPSEYADWFVSQLLDQDPGSAFRSPSRRGGGAVAEDEGWRPENLVPWDRMEHSPRVVTEYARMVERIRELFSTAPDPVRHHYLVETARALMGPEWADHAAAVARLERDRVSARGMIEEVTRVGVRPSWDHDRLIAELGPRLHVRSDGAPLPGDQLHRVAEDLLHAHRDRGGWYPEAALTLWALASTAPDSGTAGSLHRVLVELLMVVDEAEMYGYLGEGEGRRPDFVPPRLMAALREALARIEEPSRSA